MSMSTPPIPSPEIWARANAARDRARRAARVLDLVSGFLCGAAAMTALSAILLCAFAPEALAILIGAR